MSTRRTAIGSLSAAIVISTILAIIPISQASASTSRPTAPVSSRAHIDPQLGTNRSPIHAALQPAPGANVTDHGGALVTAPVVYTVEFSDSPYTLSPATGFVQNPLNTTEPSIGGAITTSLSSAYSSWWGEYSRPTTGQLLRSGRYAGTIVLYNPHAATDSYVSDASISSMLQSNSHNMPPQSTNNIFVVMFRSNQTILLSSGDSSQSGFCAYHSTAATGSAAINYIVMPNESGNPGCAFTSQTASNFDNMTPVLSHELSETITDPSSPNAWYDSGTGNEIGDICEAFNPLSSQVTGASGTTYWLQNIYSQQAGGCLSTKNTSLITHSTPSSTQVSATLTSAGVPVQSSTLSLVGPSGVIATAATNQSGLASFSYSNTDPSTLSIYYAGTATVSAAVASVGVTPGAPTLTSLTQGNGAITASWAAPVSPGSAPVTSYTASVVGGWQSCTYTVVSPENDSCTITGLSNGTNYSVSVVATNEAGASISSNSLNTTPVGPPLAPTGLAVTSTAPGQASLAWQAPALTGGDPIVSYTVSASPGGASCTTASTSCTVFGLVGGTTYNFTAIATTAFGPGAASSAASGTIPTSAPFPPTNVSVTPGDKQLSVSWTPPANNGGQAPSYYTATATGASGSATCRYTVAVPETDTCTITPLTNGTSYSVSVTATSGYGTGAPSTPVPANTPASITATIGLPSSTPLANQAAPVTVTLSPPLSAQSVTLSDGTTSMVATTDATGVATFSYSFLPGPVLLQASLPSNAAHTAASTISGAVGYYAFDSYDTSSIVSSSKEIRFRLRDGNGLLSSAVATTMANAGEIKIYPTYSPTKVICGYNSSSNWFTCPVNMPNGTTIITPFFNPNYDDLVPIAIPGHPAPSIAITNVVPSPPVSVQASPTQNSVVVAWSPTSDDLNYAQYYTATVSPGGKTCTYTQTFKTPYACTITGLTSGTSYTVSVTATGSAGTSAPSTQVSFSTPKPITLSIHTPTFTQAGASAVITVQSSLVSAGQSINLSGGSYNQTATTASNGVATFNVTQPAGVYTMTASSPGNSLYTPATATLKSLYTLYTYDTTTLTPSTKVVRFSLGAATGRISDNKASSISSAVGVSIAGYGQPSQYFSCGYTSPYFTCNIIVPTGPSTMKPTVTFGSVSTNVQRAPSGPTPAVLMGNILGSGATLASGSSLYSSDYMWRVTMRANGRLSLYHAASPGAGWVGVVNIAAGTAGSNLTMSAQGQLAIYSTSSVISWHTVTVSPGSYLTLTTAGKLQIISLTGAVLWSS